MKKFFTLGLLVIFSALFLVGCSDDTESESGSDDPLTVWAMGAEGDKLSEMAEMYTEETGVEVEVVPIPWDQAHDKLLTAVASQDGPDVVQLGTTWIAEFAEAGALADVSGYAEQYPETFSAETYFPSTEGYMYYEDKMVAVPWYVDTRVIYYRTDLLAEVGYTEPPATWEELYDCASKLVEQGVSEYGFMVDKVDPWIFQIYAWSYGWEFYDENGEVNFDDPIIQQTLEYFNQFFTEGLTPIDNSTDIMIGFSEGSMPMFASGPWMVSVIENDYPELEGKWDVAPMPAGDTQTSMIGGSALCIWEWSDQKDEAAAFIDWMNQPEQQVAWFKIAGVLPSNMAAWEDPIFAEDENLVVFESQLQVATAHPLDSSYEPITNAFIQEIEKYFYGESDIETTMQNIDVATKEVAAD